MHTREIAKLAVQYSRLRHFDELTFFLLEIWNSTIFCMFSSKIYTTKINIFLNRIKENKRRICTTALYFLHVRQERRMYNFGSPV